MIMNIYKFINSIDVRKYLEEINYQFTPIESAYVIFNSNITILERCAALCQLIAETEDAEFTDSIYSSYNMTLHEYLLSYIDRDNEILKRFNEEDGCLYTYSYRYKDERAYCTDVVDDTRIFKSFDDCARAVKRRLARGNICDVSITKQMAYSDKLKGERYITIDYNESFEEINIEFSGLHAFGIEDKFGWKPLDNICLDIPVPFKKGDIVHDVVYDRGKPVIFNGRGMDKRDNETKEEYNLRIDRIKQECWGDEISCKDIWISNNGRYYMGYGSDFLNLEYYTETLRGMQSCLRSVSDFIKGNINVEQFLTSAFLCYRREIVNQLGKFDIEWD